MKVSQMGSTKCNWVIIVCFLFLQTTLRADWMACDNAANWKAYPDWPAGHTMFSVNVTSHTEGASSIRMDYTTKKSEWHTAVYTWDFTPPLNWSGQQGLAFDLYNPDPWPKKLELIFLNGAGQKFYARNGTNFSDDNYSDSVKDYIPAGPGWSHHTFNFDNPHLDWQGGTAYPLSVWSDVRKIFFNLVPPANANQDADEHGFMLMDHYTFIPLNTFAFQTPLANGAVLQFKKKIKLWGVGTPSRTVTATLTRQRDGAVIKTLTGTIDANGYWMIPVYDLDQLTPSMDKYRFEVSDGTSQALVNELSINKAELTLPSVISDGMVMQQNETNRLWGKSGPGNTIWVELRKEADDTLLQRKSSQADANGDWRLELDPVSASFTKHKLFFTDPSRAVTVSNVLFGEVWLAAGQSNMDIGLQYIIGHANYMASAHSEFIRIFNQDKGMGLTTDLGDYC